MFFLSLNPLSRNYHRNDKDLLRHLPVFSLFASHPTMGKSVKTHVVGLCFLSAGELYSDVTLGTRFIALYLVNKRQYRNPNSLAVCYPSFLSQNWLLNFKHSSFRPSQFSLWRLLHVYSRNFLFDSISAYRSDAVDTDSPVACQIFCSTIVRLSI